MGEEEIPKFSLLLSVEPFIEVDKVPFEEDGSHLSVSELVGIDQNEAECSDGALVFGVSLKDLGGPFDFFVVS